MKNFLRYISVSTVILAISFPLQAQMFNSTSEKISESVTSRSSSNPNLQAKPATSNINADLDMTEDEEREVIDRLQKKLEPRIENGNLVINPIDLGKTQDGSPRGTSAFISTNSDAGTEEGNIFLYYSNFQIKRTAATGVGCRVRFHVLNGLNSRVSNISIKLVWPNLNTPLSFDNVNPNSENYFDYALFGEGCYQMDKIPNIVVNRCRVKGMSQKACANRIRWLTKR